MNDGPFFALLTFATALFFGLIGGLVYTKHAQTIACIEARGTLIGGVCAFLPTPTEQQQKD